MPLVPNRTVMTLNSWTPNGSLGKDSSNSSLPDTVFLPQKSSSKWKMPPVPGEGRKDSQGLRSVALKAIALNLQPFRHNGINKNNNSSNGFAGEPKPKTSESPLTGVFREAGVTHEQEATTPVQSPTNRNVHFDTDRRRRSSLGGCPVQSVCPDAFVHCASALFLATNGSPQSLGHLRKWNSQSCLSATTQDKASDSQLRGAGRPALRRNTSLPDFGQWDSAGLQIDSLRPQQLVRSPSDTAGPLSFWLEDREQAKTFNRRRTMVYVPGIPQIVLQGQSELLTLGPQLLAQELTLLAKELLLDVGTSELLTYVMKPRMAQMDTCPNLHRLFQFYDRLSSLVTTEILKNQTSSERAQTVALFIEMANQCDRLQNWQSCVTLLSGIRSPPVVRLKETWSHLRTEFPDHFQSFERLLAVSCGPEESVLEQQVHRPAELGGTPRPMAAVSYFGEIASRARVLPNDQLPRSPRTPWKEPPSLAKWVAEQTTSEEEEEWGELNSPPHGNQASRYLKAFVLGKNLFCPVEKMPRRSRSPTPRDGSEPLPADDSALQRLNLTQQFDDPDSLPFASRQVQCCALQPSSLSQIRHRVEVILRSAQTAARAYDLQSDQACRRYWLRQPYSNKTACMKRSLLLERAKPKELVV